MRTVAEHIEKGRKAIVSSKYLLDGGFVDEAARDAYMAVFHAALALIVARTGKEPRTHRGTHIEFARICRDEPGIDHDIVASLSQYYEFKDFSDYGNGLPVAVEDARLAIDHSEVYLSKIAELLHTPGDP